MRESVAPVVLALFVACGFGLLGCWKETAPPTTEETHRPRPKQPPAKQRAAVGASGEAGSTEPPLPSPDVPDVETYRKVARPILCEREVRCGRLGRSELQDCLAGDGSIRPDPVMGLWDELEFPRLLAEGQMIYDPTRAGECLAYLRDATCFHDPVEAPEDCSSGWPPLQPGVEPGRKCERFDACVGGFCTAQPGCRGKCVAYSDRGGECGNNQLCQREDYCSEGKCVPRLKRGESCPGHWRACGDGLWCEGYQPEVDHHEYWRPAVPGKCAEPKGGGFECATDGNDEHCRGDLFCDWGREKPICSERLEEGSECRWLYSCRDGLECVGLRLGGSHPAGRRYGVVRAGVCKPFQDVGGACDPADYLPGCPSSMSCDAETRTCRGSGHEGDRCDSSWVRPDEPRDRPVNRDSCRGGLYCHPGKRVCVRQLKTGAKCVPRGEYEDDPCFMGECDRKTRRCKLRCKG